MGFELMIWNANKSAVLNTITQATPSGLDGGFKWQLRGNGDTVQLDLAGRNDRMKLPPRGVVRLKVDGGAAFYGIVPDPPSGDSQVVEQVQVLGGREALRVTLLDGAVYRAQGVFQIVRDVLTRLCPPALTYSAALIGNGSGTDAGPELSLYYSPTSDLVTVLDSLAKSANTGWGVDNQGRVFFGRPAPAPLAVPYVRQPWRRLPVQGKEAVTRAVLRIVSAPVLPDNMLASWADEVPQTVTTVATAATHALYRAEQTFPVPEGVGLIVPAVPAGTNLNSDYPADAVMDDDAGTGVNIDLTNTTRFLVVNSAPGRVVGVEFDYQLPNTSDTPTDAYAWSLNLNEGEAGTVGNLPVSNERRTVRAILPPTARATGTWTARFTIGANIAIIPTPTTLLTITRVRFLVIDEAAALRVAESFLQSPFAKPTEITLGSLEPPTPAVTVTGSPDGDVTGDTGIWEYTHQPGGLRRTLIRIGSDGQAPAARAIKLAVKAAR